MDAARAYDFARKILDAKMFPYNFTMEQLLAIKAAVPAMDLPQFQKDIVIARMGHQLVQYNIELLQQMKKQLSKQIELSNKANQEKSQENAQKTQKSSSHWIRQIYKGFQRLFSAKPSESQKNDIQNSEQMQPLNKRKRRNQMKAS